MQASGTRYGARRMRASSPASAAIATDAKATAEAFARAAHVTRLDTWINRVTGVPTWLCKNSTRY